MTAYPGSGLSIEQLVFALEKAVITDNGCPGSPVLSFPAKKIFALEQRITRVLAIVRSATNQTASVNRLPPEVLTKILEFRHSDKDLISATHVCEMWRSTLLSTPLLWTEIEFGKPDRTSAYLERSKNALLHVSVRDSTLNPGDLFVDDMSWFNRTSSLHIHADPDQIERIARYLCLPAPVLQSLVINGTRAFGTSGPVHIPPNFLDQQAPFLRNLTFVSASPAPFASPPLHNITNLRWTNRTSLVAIEQVLAVLTSAPLLEVLNLNLEIQPTTEAERPRCITLGNLRRLAWTNYGGSFSLMPLLVTPELEESTIHVVSDCDLSTVLPPHRDHFPLLTEPTALRYSCRGSCRSCHFTCSGGHISIDQAPLMFGIFGRHSVDRWPSPNTPISFRKIKHLAVEGFDGHPLPGDIPVEQFESLESLELMGEVERLLSIIRPDGGMDGGVLPVPFSSLRELRLAFDGGDVPFETLVEVLKERKEAGHGIKGVHITGQYSGYSSEEALELTGLVGGVTEGG